MRLCRLRLDPQAQKEIREYATIVSTLLETSFPASMKAFFDNQSS
jgi:thymidylate synthase ThyX